MLCFIYKSLKKDQLYVYINTKDDFSKIPENLFNSLGELKFVMELELTPQQKLARIEPEKVIASLDEKGFFIQMPPVILSPSQTQH